MLSSVKKNSTPKTLSTHCGPMLATMGIIDKQLFSSFIPTAAKSIDSSNNQTLANIAWAYKVADIDAPNLFNGSYINACIEKNDGFKNENESLFQLYQ